MVRTEATGRGHVWPQAGDPALMTLPLPGPWAPLEDTSPERPAGSAAGYRVVRRGHRAPGPPVFWGDSRGQLLDPEERGTQLSPRSSGAGRTWRESRDHPDEYSAVSCETAAGVVELRAALGRNCPSARRSWKRSRVATPSGESTGRMDGRGARGSRSREASFRGTRLSAGASWAAVCAHLCAINLPR